MADNESSEIETRRWLRGRGRAGAQYDAVNEASDKLSCAARAVAAGAKKISRIRSVNGWRICGLFEKCI